jgi:hypothetical protein
MKPHIDEQSHTGKMWPPSRARRGKVLEKRKTGGINTFPANSKKGNRWNMQGHRKKWHANAKKTPTTLPSRPIARPPHTSPPPIPSLRRHHRRYLSQKDGSIKQQDTPSGAWRRGRKVEELPGGPAAVVGRVATSAGAPNAAVALGTGPTAAGATGPAIAAAVAKYFIFIFSPYIYINDTRTT